MHEFVIRILLLVLGWKLLWKIVHLVSGFHVSYITINNGIAVNGVCFDSKKASIRAGSIRFRVWGDSRRIIVSDLTIVTQGDLDRSEKPAKNTPKPAGALKSDPIAVLPLKLLPRTLLKWLLRWLRLDIEIKSATFTHNTDIVKVETLSFSVLSPFKNKAFGLRLQLAGSGIVCILGPSGAVPPLLVGTFAVQTRATIDATLGVVSNTVIRVYVDDAEFDVFQIIKTLLSLAPASKPPRRKLQSKLDKLLELHYKLQGVQEISISAGNLCIKGVPLFPASHNCSLKEYFKQREPETSISLALKSITLHFGTLLDTSAGFDVLFTGLDKPFQLTAAMLLLQFTYIKKTRKEESWISETDEILNVPNFNFTLKTNVTDNLAKGNGFRNCVLELFLSASSPVLDLSAEQCALIIYNYVVLKKLAKLRKLKKRHQYENPRRTPEYESDDEDVTKVGDSLPGTPTIHRPALGSKHPPTLIDRIVTLLNENYPRIDVKFIIEQPRSVMRLQSESRVQMLNFSYSMLFLHVLTSSSGEYEAKGHVAHPSITFAENFTGLLDVRLYLEEVCGFQSAKVLVNILRNLKVNAKFGLDGLSVNLSKADVLNGINHIFSEITEKTSRRLKRGLVNKYYDGEIVRECKIYPEQTEAHKQHLRTVKSTIFTSLPAWLISVDFQITDVDIQLGSTSPLLPSKLISQLSLMSTTSFRDTSNTLRLRFSSLTLGVANDDSAEAEVNSADPSSSLETLASESLSHEFWKVDTELKGLNVAVTSAPAPPSTVVEIPTIAVSVTAVTRDLQNKLLFDLDADELSGTLDRYKLFVIIGLVHLLMQTIVAPIKQVKKKMKHGMASLHLHETKAVPFHYMEVLSSEVHLHTTDYTVCLSDDFKVRLQLFGLSAVTKDGFTTVTNRFARLLADSPIAKGYWNRIICIDDLSVKIKDPSESQLFVIHSTSIKISQPHKFVVYKLFDNMGVFVKIAKHLFKCLKSSAEKNTVVLPTQSPALLIPDIKLKAEKLVFSMEDDPFEVDLNMIYQLGLTEQRKRLEMTSLFEERAKHIADEDDVQEKHEFLQQAIGALWIRKVRVYKAKLAQEIDENGRYLFGNELDIPERENHRICNYAKNAPLLNLLLAGVDLDLSTTKFSLAKLPDFIYDLGQQVPKDTPYNLMIPAYINLAVEEVRIHLRDYPLPLLHLPKATDNKGKGRSLLMQGHILISEALILKEEHLRKLQVQLSRTTNNDECQLNGFDKLTIMKSLSTVKLYTDLDILFDSKSPSRFVWGKSYQFGIQQIMLNTDQFSKPPVDPSIKLGFWDKLRLVMHGKCSIRAGQEGSLEVAFKGGSDPYNLFGESSGFILEFKDDVHWKVNENDNSLQFFDIHSLRVSWYIPNYSVAPLLSWTRDSSESTFLPNVKEIVTSSFGYYLNDVTSRPADKDPNLPPTFDIHEKRVVELTGGVKFNVGFLLQRKARDGKGVTNDCKPHYEVQLYNPDFTAEGHDSYEGFRSERLHMAISLVAHTESSYNTIHLSPGTFNQLFAWWGMFHGNTLLPVRRGKLFGENKSSAKFSEHLYTNKFLFRLKNLFIAHMYSDGSIELQEDSMEFIGLRAKVSDFLVDLHQRKEERISIHEDLSRRHKVMKMGFNLGEVVLSKIDLRVVYAKYQRNLYDLSKLASDIKCKFSIFDKDKQWFDERDYEESFVGPSKGQKQKVEVLPMLYSERFSYIRNTTDVKDDNEWGTEQTHECKMQSSEDFTAQIDMLQRRLKDLQKLSKDRDHANVAGETNLEQRIAGLQNSIRHRERARIQTSKRSNSLTSAEFDDDENFHNRFILVSMFFKWNEKVRNLFMKYIHFVQLKSNMRKYLSYDFIQMLKGIIDKDDGTSIDGASLTSSAAVPQHIQQELKSVLNKFGSSQERLDNFDRTVREVKDNEQILEDYKIEIIGPQIQLHTEEVDDSVVMITAPLLEAKIFSVITKRENDKILNAREIETRYGVLLHNATVMVINKDDVKLKSAIFERTPYGTTSQWPPWLGVEICRDSSLARKENVLMNDTSVMLTYEQVKALGSTMERMEGAADTSYVNEEIDSANRLRVDVPNCTITSTSKQYFALYVTVLSLLLYAEPMSVHLREKLLKLKFSIDFHDLSALHSRLVDLHSYLGVMKVLLNNYSFRHNKLDNEGLNEFLLLNSEQESVTTEIYLMLQSLLSGDLFEDSSQPMEDWRIATDKIVLHMLQDNREPILDMVIDRGRFKRVVKEDGSNINRIEIKRIEGLNLVPGAYYKKFLTPMELQEDDDMITVDWSMNRSIGGIRIMENFDISSQPLKVNLDEVTGKQLMKFVFQTENEDEIVESPLLRVADRTRNDGTGDDDDEAVEDSDSEKELSKKNVRFDKGRSASFSSKRSLTKSLVKSGSISTGSNGDGEFQDEVEKMMARSKSYLSIVEMAVRAFDVMISLRLKSGYKRLLNVTNFRLELPEWRIEMQILSMLEIAEVFKKMVIKALLAHSGRLIKNKLTSRHKNARR